MALTPHQQRLKEIVSEQEDNIRRWVSSRPTVTRDYEGLSDDVGAGRISLYEIPQDEWTGVVMDEGKFPYSKRKEVGGFFSEKGRGGGKSIYYPEGKFERVAKHELMHYFASHKPDSKGTPEKINPYIRADMKLKGWLPSFHPGGRRPTMPGKTPLGEWWNKNKATTSVEYSDRSKYHPWFDEHSFDKGLEEKGSLLGGLFNKDIFGKFIRKKDKVKGKPVAYDGNHYPIYDTKSNKAQSFRTAFAGARKGGKDTFEWDGRSYTTELK